MKKIIVTLLCFALALPLVGCGTKTVQNDRETEGVPADYGDAIVVAQEEFDRVFSEYDNMIITQTATMVRTNNENRLIIQFTYSSSNGNGVYGFEIEKTATGSYDLIQQGENITIDNLVQNQ